MDEAEHKSKEGKTYDWG